MEPVDIQRAWPVHYHGPGPNQKYVEVKPGAILLWSHNERYGEVELDPDGLRAKPCASSPGLSGGVTNQGKEVFMSYHDEQALLDLQEKQNKTGSDGKQKNVPKWSGFSKKDSFQFESKKGNSQHVKITSISIPFHQMVWLLVQLSLAAIPAAIIVMLIWSFIIQIISESF